MAKSDRQENVDAKNLEQILRQVDDRIQLPPHLRGDVLLASLDNIHHPAPVSRKIRFSPSMFNWQSGAVFAAAFAMCIALFLFFGRGGTALLEGDIPIADTAELAEQAAPQIIAFDAPMEIMEDAAADQAAPPADTGPQTRGLAPDSPADTEDSAPPSPAGGATEAADQGPMMARSFSFPMGGQGESILLGEADGYSYNWRLNDLADPDKGMYPITVSVLEIATETLSFEIDVPDMVSVERYFVSDHILVLAGTAPTGGIALRTYDLATPGDAMELTAVTQPGILLDARLYQKTLHVASYGHRSIASAYHMTTLPYGTSELCNLFTSLNLDSSAVTQAAFDCGSDQVSLTDQSATITYPGDNDSEYTAQIQLEDMKIQLGNTTQQK